MSLERIYDLLVSQSPPNVFNPWRDVDDDLDLCGAAPDHRWVRLTQHFSGNPRLLLVGEAPGYKGCRVSGVPFTSEQLLLDRRVPRVSSDTRMTRGKNPQKEGTATKFWRALEDFKVGDLVVMWNAFPWHPYDLTKGPRSNRTPNRSELALGGEVLRAVLGHFEGVAVLPVGRKAEGSLSSLGVPALDWIYHPSRSRYEPQFRAGLRERLELLKMC